MLRVIANNAYNALAVDNLAFIAHFFYRRTNFHITSVVVSGFWLIIEPET